jgi:FtsZ-interacting cell division protein ZipA
MSELQLWLVVLGVVIVATVLIVNKMQEAKARRRAERAFGDKPADILLGETHGAAQPAARKVEATPDIVEPTLSPPVMPDATALSAERIDHNLGLPTPPALPAGAGPVNDPHVDGLATIVMSTAQPGETILRHAEALLADVERPVAWEGLDDAGQHWVKLSPKSTYQAIRAGIQLVDRRGQVTEAELNRAFARLQELAATLAGELQLPSRGETMRTAQRLDVFCSEVDVQIGLNIIKRDGSAFVGTRVRQVVEASGLVLGTDGRFSRGVAGGGESYYVANLEPNLFLAETMASLSTHTITVVLDVPRVSAAGTTFAAFREFAFQLAKTLDGQVVDDNRQPIQAPALEAIGREVEGIRARMSADGMEPGGAIALRVFA